jgi:predicted alpha/beta hydrolase
LPDVVPCPVIAGYPLETIISEKLHAIAQFGNDNTRHKDYYDIWRIQSLYEIEGRILSRAITNTFENQGRSIDPGMPGLSDDFGVENERAWRAFLRKTNLKDDVSLVNVIAEMREFLVPAMSEDIAVDAKWVPNEGWDGLGPNHHFTFR